MFIFVIEHYEGGEKDLMRKEKGEKEARSCCKYAKKIQRKKIIISAPAEYSPNFFLHHYVYRDSDNVVGDCESNFCDFILHNMYRLSCNNWKKYKNFLRHSLTFDFYVKKIRKDFFILFYFTLSPFKWSR